MILYTARPLAEKNEGHQLMAHRGPGRWGFLTKTEQTFSGPAPSQQARGCSGPHRSLGDGARVGSSVAAGGPLQGRVKVALSVFQSMLGTAFPSLPQTRRPSPMMHNPSWARVMATFTWWGSTTKPRNFLSQLLVGRWSISLLGHVRTVLTIT